MLQRIREGLQTKKWVAWVILGAIAAAFVFTGGAGSLDFSSVGANTAAEVDGVEIPADKATRAWSQMQSQYAQFGMEIPADQQKARQDQIIEDLVLEAVINERMREQHFRVSDDAVFDQWGRIPEFQTDGVFDRTKVIAYLANTGQTEHEYRDGLRNNMLQGQLQRGLGDSGFLTRAEQQRLFNLENEEREVQYLQLSPEKYMGSEPIAESEVEAYHASHSDEFKTTEYVALEYAELRLEQLASQVIPTDDDLRKLYDENSALYVTEEARRARSIIIGVGEGMDDAEALKKAEAVAAEARGGKDFAELAKKNSTDVVTAATGGDLGFVTRDQFQDPTIGDTLFSMNVGDVAGPVKTQFGYQIVKLEEIQARQARPFEEVRAELDSQYRSGHSAELFGERQEQISAALDKGETDLDKLSSELGLTRGSIDNFPRGGGVEPLGSSPELQQKIFSDATLNQRKIGGPVFLGEDRLVIFKVREHHKAVVKPVAEVREEIIARLRHERGVAAAKSAAEAALKRLEGGEKIEEVAKGLGLTVDAPRFVGRADPSLKADLRIAVFEAPRPEGAPVARMAALEDGSSALFVLSRSRVADATTNPVMTAEQNQQLEQRATRGELFAYLYEARRKAKVVKNPKVFGE
jgi:peptidyl-prolyl cis-trans isomerase D